MFEILRATWRDLVLWQAMALALAELLVYAPALRAWKHAKQTHPPAIHRRHR